MPMNQDQFLTALREKVSKGRSRKIGPKLDEDKLQKVQLDRIWNAKRRAGAANIANKDLREKLYNEYLNAALVANLKELKRRKGLSMTLDQYRASVGL